MRRTKKPTPTAAAPQAREAVIYLRVSSQEQAASGLGLEAQEFRCRGYAASNGWEVVAVYKDAGASAKNLKRPELERALEALRPGQTLIAYKVDRLTRSLADFPVLHERITAAGADLATVEEKFDTSTAIGRAALHIVLVFSQMERELIGERTSAALGAKRARGERLGAVPMGYALDESGDLCPVPQEQATLKRAAELRRAGASLRQIAETLTNEGHPTKRGGKWAAATVRGILSHLPPAAGIIRSGAC